MRVDQEDPYSLRWKIATAVGPERVALALVIVLAIAVLLLVRLGPSQGDIDVSRPSPTPSVEVESRSPVKAAGPQIEARRWTQRSSADWPISGLPVEVDAIISLQNRV